MTDPDHPPPLDGHRIPIPDAELRTRALLALRQGRFDLAEELLASGDADRAALVENLRIYQAELEIQNEELLHSQRQTQEALARFMAFFNSLPLAELIVDRHGLVKETNPAAQRLFGLHNGHFHHYFLTRLVEEADRDALVGAWDGLRHDQRIDPLELRFRTADGTPFVGDLHIAPLPPAEDREPLMVCAVVDRTEAAKQRQVLKTSEERLRLSEATLRERLKELGCLHDVLLATTGSDTNRDRVLQRIVDRLPAAWQFPDLAEARLHLPDACYQTPGFVATHWSQNAPVPLVDARPGRLTVAYRDPPPGTGLIPFMEEEQGLLDAVANHIALFLARRHDEAELRETRERYRVIAQFSPDWEYWLAPEGRYRYVSPACERMTGYPAESFMSDPTILARLIHPADLARWQHHGDLAIQTQVPDPDGLEFRLITRDGQTRWIEHICNPVITEDGRYLGRRGVNRDITKRKDFEEALRRSEDFLNVTGRMARVGGWEVDQATRAVRWTRVTHEIHEVVGTEPPTLDAALEFFHPDDRPRLQQSLERALTLGEPYDLQVRLTTAQGRPLWVQVTCQPVMEEARVVKLLGTIQDVTARVEAEVSLRQAARVFESTIEGVVITDPDERILAVNRAFTNITGYTEAEVRGKTPRVLKSGLQDVNFYRALWDELIRTGQWRGELWNRHKDGQIYPELMTISAVYDSTGHLTHYVGLFRDISHIKRSEQQLEYLAHHDSLTGLPNRSLFRSRLEQSLQRAARSGRQVALLFLDLDRFKTVNDTLGHSVGDDLLQGVAETLAGQVRAADTIARLGGDEFVVILEDIAEPRDAAHFTDRLLALFRQPFKIRDHELFVTTSIGISLYPRDGKEIDTLLRHADIAMYQAKGEGRNGYRFFEPIMAEGAADRLSLENDLRGALQRDEFILHYQPQVALADGGIRGVEALCRWRHPRLGVLAPNQFIPLAEDIGIIADIGAWVLDQGCRQLIAWDRLGFRVPRLAVNLSVRQIEQSDLVNQVRKILWRTGLEPARLELEVTESMIMRRTETAIATLEDLRTLGVTLSVDDFGTGYSSLGYLKRLPLHRLKIDKSFVERLTQDPNDDAIARAIIALGRSLGLDVLAEGIETPAQMDFLRGEGCDEGQGYLFSRPVSAEDLLTHWAEIVLN